MSGGFASLGADFEPFLFAIVCDQANGTPLTMASLIARAGLDPWQEAARISNLRRDQALSVVTGLIPLGVQSDIAPGTLKDVGARLLGLLPRARSVQVPVVKSAARYEVFLFGFGVVLFASVVLGQIVWSNMQAKHEAAKPAQSESTDTRLGQ